jgi:hypothetical protein
VRPGPNEQDCSKIHRFKILELIIHTNIPRIYNTYKIILTVRIEISYKTKTAFKIRINSVGPNFPRLISYRTSSTLSLTV